MLLINFQMYFHWREAALADTWNMNIIRKLKSSEINKYINHMLEFDTQTHIKHSEHWSSSLTWNHHRAFQWATAVVETWICFAVRDDLVFENLKKRHQTVTFCLDRAQT